MQITQTIHRSTLVLESTRSFVHHSYCASPQGIEFEQNLSFFYLYSIARNLVQCHSSFSIMRELRSDLFTTMYLALVEVRGEKKGFANENLLHA